MTYIRIYDFAHIAQPLPVRCKKLLWQAGEKVNHHHIWISLHLNSCTGRHQRVIHVLDHMPLRWGVVCTRSGEESIRGLICSKKTGMNQPAFWSQPDCNNLCQILYLRGLGLTFRAKRTPPTYICVNARPMEAGH